MEQEQKVTKRFSFPNSHVKVFSAILVISVIAGLSTGYLLASNSSKGTISTPLIQDTPKMAEQDAKTFRDFAEGKVAKKPEPKGNEEYSEGTHLLIRDGTAPVALTSSVVDLSQYEGKKVKVYGETQKALKEGWLMDVGRVEEIK